MEWLEARGLDVELCSRLGLESHRGDGGEAILIPTIRNGEIVRRKYRPLERREGQSKFYQEKGGQKLPYNVDCLYRADLYKRPLVITEGELDAVAGLQAGVERIISVPDGAPGTPVEDLENSKAYDWMSAVWPALTKAQTVVLATDGDGPGAALMHDLSLKLGKTRCKYVTYPLSRDRAKRLKDLNEVLLTYGEAGVRTVIERAQFIKVDGVYAMSQLPPVPDSVIYDIGFEALGKCMAIRLGDISAATGVPSHGKSTFINDMICRVVERYRVRVAFASFEQEPQRDHRRALRSWFCQDYEPKLTHEQRWAADTWIDEQFRFLVPSDEEDPTLEWLLEKMEAAVIQHDCKIIIIDPWNEAVHERLNGETETDYTNRSLRTLARFAKRFQVHVMIVAHPTKLQRKDDGSYPVPSLYDISGSAAWYNKPVIGFIVHRPTPDESIVKVQKVRYQEILGEPNIVKFHYSKQTRRFIEVERNVEDIDEHRRRKRS
jgi:twinkle protein